MKREFCGCRCHATARADYRAYLQLGAWWQLVDAGKSPTLNVEPSASVMDALEAAAACPLCLSEHCPALSLRHIWSEQRDRAEWVDPPPKKVDEGEGRED